MGRIARIFGAGFIAALPLIITVAVSVWLMTLIIDYAGPSSRFGRVLISMGVGFNTSSVPPYLLGLAIIFAAIYVLGLLVESRLGEWTTAIVDRIVRPIPGISSVYDLSKRFTSIVDFKGNDSLASMSAVWCFFGGESGAAVLALLPSSKPVVIGKDEYLGILVPSAPVPVGGALIYVPASWIKPATGGVEHLMSVYVSMGVTPPQNTPA